MQKIIAFVLLFAFSSVSASAETADLLNTLSPKLRELLKGNTGASNILADAISKAFVSKKAKLYYYYSDDANEPRAYHYYRDDSVLCMAVRENQAPWDEFICVLFETINSTAERNFRDIYLRAQNGTLSRASFAQEMLRQEFQALTRTRDVLKGIKISKGDVDKSYYYSRFIGCPDDFEEFLRYTKKVSQNRDAISEYESHYDRLKGDTANSNPLSPPRELQRKE